MKGSELVEQYDAGRRDFAGADLSWANLTGANLRGADLSGADLRMTDLPRADLTGTNLSGANLSGANLCGASLAEAYLAGADLTNAEWNRCTQWPVGFRPPPFDPEGVALLVKLLNEADTTGLLERLTRGHSLQPQDDRTMQLAGALLYYSDLNNPLSAQILLAALDSRAHSAAPVWDALCECARAGRDQFPLAFPEHDRDVAARFAITEHIEAFYDDCDNYNKAVVVREDEEANRGLPPTMGRIPVIVGKTGSRLFYPPLPGCVRLVEMPWDPDEQAERETLRRSGSGGQS